MNYGTRVDRIEQRVAPKASQPYLNFMTAYYHGMAIDNPFKATTRDFLNKAGIDTNIIDSDNRVYYFENGKLAYRNQEEQAEIDKNKRDRELVMQEYMRLRTQYFSATLTPGRKLELDNEMDILRKELGLS
jgi:hypothetical protein